MDIAISLFLQSVSLVTALSKDREVSSGEKPRNPLRFPLMIQPLQRQYMRDQGLLESTCCCTSQLVGTLTGPRVPASLMPLMSSSNLPPPPRVPSTPSLTKRDGLLTFSAVAIRKSVSAPSGVPTCSCLS